MTLTREVLGFEIGARSLVEVLPVVKVKSDKNNLNLQLINGSSGNKVETKDGPKLGLQD